MNVLEIFETIIETQSDGNSTSPEVIATLVLAEAILEISRNLGRITLAIEDLKKTDLLDITR